MTKIDGGMKPPYLFLQPLKLATSWTSQTTDMRRT